MNCGQISSLSNNYPTFGNKSANNMKNAALSFNVVSAPDKLPTTSLYETVYSNQSLDPNLEAKMPIGEETKSAKAGKFAAGCTFTALALSALSLLPFIRKH